MKKSGKTTKKAGKSRRNVKTTNVATRNPTSRTELNTLGIFDSWVDYSKQVENQIERKRPETVPRSRIKTSFIQAAPGDGRFRTASNKGEDSWIPRSCR